MSELQGRSSPTNDGAYPLAFLAEYREVEGGRVLPQDDCIWGIDYSPIGDYGARTHLPEYQRGLVGIIEDQIGRDASNVGLDLAGGHNGTALRNLMEMGLLSKSLVTNAADHRSKMVRRDTRLDHIAGDLLNKSTWLGILDWQQKNAPDGLALILHRPAGALQLEPANVYRGAAHVLIDMMRPGGLLFTQIPRGMQFHDDQGLPILNGIRNRQDVGKVIVARKQPGVGIVDELYRHLFVIKTPVSPDIKPDMEEKRRAAVKLRAARKILRLTTPDTISFGR